MTADQLRARIQEVEQTLASAKAHFTDYDQAGEDIAKCEAELESLRAELAKFSYTARATDWRLWQEYVDPDGTMTEDEFNSLTIEQKERLQI